MTTQAERDRLLTDEQLAQIADLVDAAPPLTQHQQDVIRRVFARNAAAYDAATTARGTAA